MIRACMNRLITSIVNACPRTFKKQPHEKQNPLYPSPPIFEEKLLFPDTLKPLLLKGNQHRFCVELLWFLLSSHPIFTTG